MVFTQRKKYQRKLNHLVKLMNQNIANDTLWLGRFEIRQKAATYEEFQDHSGGMLYVKLRAYDKATGYYKDYQFDYTPWSHRSTWHLWEIMNQFITEETGVWQSEPRPGRDTGFIKDYRGQHIPDEVMAKEYNWFMNYDAWARAKE